MVNNKGQFFNQATMARLLHWYISVAIWGRFSVTVETVINQDLAALAKPNPIDSLLQNLRLSQGERKVAPENFDLRYNTARFYPMLYVMSRIQGSQDWETGNHLRHHSLVDHSKLELHHIFPKAYLRRNGVSAKDANNMGNIAFQTRETWLAIGKTPPVEYMPKVAKNWPGVLESQWIPTDRELWKVENYHRFLEDLRNRLANSVNELLEANRVAMENGLPAGEITHEVYAENTGELAVLDLAWPDGLQTGYSQPIALMIDADDTTWRTASNAGFKVLTSLDDFRRYVERDILAAAD